MDEQACRDLIESSKEIALIRGGKKEQLREQVTIDFAFASVCTIAPIKKGEQFTKDNIWVKRPGTGQILAQDFKSILGKKAKVEIELDSQLKWDDVEF